MKSHEGTIFPVHSVILRRTSPVFESLILDHLELRPSLPVASDSSTLIEMGETAVVLGAIIQPMYPSTPPYDT